MIQWIRDSKVQAIRGETWAIQQVNKALGLK